PCDPFAWSSQCDYTNEIFCDSWSNSFSFTCQPVGYAPVGGTCWDGLNHQYKFCTAGASCAFSPDLSSGTCIAPAADGASCGGSIGCSPPATCLGGVCTIVPPTSCG